MPSARGGDFRTIRTFADELELFHAAKLRKDRTGWTIGVGQSNWVHYNDGRLGMGGLGGI